MMYFEDEEVTTYHNKSIDEKLANKTHQQVFGKKQIGGDHYQLPIQPVDFIVKNGLGYREGNAIKYITRHKSKNGKQDIEKAIHYLEMILEDYND